MTTFALTGSGNWISPITGTVRVQAWAGNASGGGTGAVIGWNGGGGGAGEYAEEATYAVTTGQSIPYVVGLGGIAKTNAKGADGTNTTFGTVVAHGGKGGLTSQAGNAAGGLGGTGSINTIHHNGGNGGAGVVNTSSGGAGGGAGTLANGNNGAGITGGGAVTGGAAGPNGTSTGNGTAGTAPNGTTTGGSPGAGAYSNTGATRTSGAGTAGQILLTYTPPATSNPYVMANPVPAASTTATTVPVTTPSNAGDAIVICACTSPAAANSPSAVSDSKGNAYLLAQAVLSNLATWVADGPTALTTSDTGTVNWTTSGSNVKDVQIIGVPNVAANSALDTIATNSASGTSTSVSVTSGTIANPGSVAIFVINNASAGGAPGTFGSFTSLGSVQLASNQYLTVAYQLLSATTPVTATATITSAAWSADLLILSPVAIGSSAGTVVGATVEAGSYGGSLNSDIGTWVNTVINPGRTLDSIRVFFGAGNIPSSLAASGLAQHVGVRRVLLSMKPSVTANSSDLAAIDNFLSQCKNAGLDAKVALNHEPSPEETATQYITKIKYYGPTVRKYYPLVYCQAAYRQHAVPGTDAAYYPGDAFVDECAYDFYEYDYRLYGQTLSPMAAVADGASPPKPFSAWELGVVVGGVNGTTAGSPGSCTPAQGTAYMNYCTTFFKARLDAGKPVGDVSYYDYINASKNWDHVIQPGSYLAPLYDTLYDSLQPVGGGTPATVNISAESDIVMTSSVTLTAPAPGSGQAVGTAVTLFGASATFGSQALLPYSTTNHTFAATGVPNWGLGPGLSVFYSKATGDGQLILGTLPVSGNELKPTMDHAELDVFDPTRLTFYRNIIPTSAGATVAVDPATHLGGTDAGGGDVNVVSVTGTEKVVATLEGYYFNWDIGIYGTYPVLCYLTKDGSGNWSYDAAQSKTSNQWEATNTAVYDSVIGAGLGQTSGLNGTYWGTRAAGQICILPASGRLVILHYFGKGTNILAGIISVSTQAGTLLAAYQLPNIIPTDGTTITSLDPRDVRADLSSVINDERFVIIYDAFGTNVQQCAQEFSWNDGTSAITAKSVPFCSTDTAGTRHTDPVFVEMDSDGTLFLSCGSVLASKPMAVWNKNAGTGERSYVTNFPATGISAANGSFLTGNASGFEGGIANWVAITNCAVAQSALQAHTGTKSLAMTSSAGGAMTAAHVAAGSITTLGFSVASGETVKASAWFRTAVTAQSCNIGVDFYTITGSLISTLRGSNITDSSAAWTQATASVIAPATAGWCRANPQVVTTGGASEVHFVDDVLLASWATASWPTPADPDFTLGFPVTQNLGALAGPLATDPVTGTVMIAGNYFSGTLPDANHTALGANAYSARVASAEPANTLSADDSIFDTSVGSWTAFLGSITRNTAPPVAVPAGVNCATVGFFAGSSTGSTGAATYVAAPGQTWEGVIYFLQGTASRTCEVWIRWLTSIGGNLGDTTHGTGADNAVTWTRLKSSGVAPANTAFAQLWWQVDSAAENHFIAANELHNMDPALDGFGSFVTTIAYSSTQALDGFYSLAITAPFNNEVLAANSPDIPVFPGQDYLGKASFRAQTTGRAVTMSMKFKDYTGAFIAGFDVPSSKDITTTTSGWTEARVAGIAPLNAATAQIVFQPVTVSIGETLYADRISISRNPFTPFNKVDYGLIGIRNDRPADIQISQRPSVIGRYAFVPIANLMGSTEQADYNANPGSYSPTAKPQYVSRVDLTQVLVNGGLFTPTPVVPALPQVQSPWKFLYGPVQPTGGVTAEITQARSRSLTMRAGPGVFSEVDFDLNGLDFTAGQLTELQTDIQVYWGNNLLFIGRVGTSSDNLDGDEHRATITAVDYREVLRRRILTDATNLNFTGSEVAFIAWTLINTVQGYNGGALGIGRGRGQVTGIKQTWTASKSDYVGEDIDTLAGMDPNFDWDITPYGTSDLRLDVWPGVRGVAKGVILEQGGSLVSSINRTVDPSTYGNAVYLTGGSGASPPLTDVVLEASDLNVRPEGRFDRLIGTDFILSASLQASAQGYLKDAEKLLPTYSIVLKPGVWMGPDHLWIGDTVHVRIKSGRLLVDDLVFVTEMQFDISPDGVETLSLTAGRIPFRLRLKLPRMLRAARGKNSNTLL